MPDMKTQTINGVVYNMVDQPSRDNLAKHMADKANPHGVTAAQVGAPTMDYAKKVGAPYNLLDNSYFRNPVNQRGAASTNADWQCWLDRWIVNAASSTLTLTGNGVKFKCGTDGHNARLIQRVPFNTIDPTKTYTVAICDSDGNVACKSGAPFTSLFFYDNYLQFGAGDGSTYYYFILDVYTDITICWLALYEGEYTAETLPEYQPKGYAAELLECQRYYYRINFGWTIVAIASKRYAKSLRAVVPYPINMRAVPTVTMPNLTSIVAVGVDGNIPITNIEYAPSRQFVTLTITTETEVTHDAHGIYAGRDGAYIEASADL